MKQRMLHGPIITVVSVGHLSSVEGVSAGCSSAMPVLCLSEAGSVTVKHLCCIESVSVECP